MAELVFVEKASKRVITLVDAAITPDQPDLLRSRLSVRYETGTYYVDDVDQIQDNIIDPLHTRDSCSRKRYPSSGRYPDFWIA